MRYNNNTECPLVWKELPCRWDDARTYCSGLASVKLDGRWGFVDKAGTLVIPCTWDDTSDFQEDLARVRKGEKYGFIDKTGTVIATCQWDYAEDFR